MNIPYTPKFDAKGNCTNLITRSNPYLHSYPNRRIRRMKQNRPIGNHKGTSLIITDVSKTKRHLQRVGNKSIIQYFITYFKR